MFEPLAVAGVAVYSLDVHGHGRSQPTEPGERGLIRDYNHLVRCFSTSTSALLLLLLLLLLQPCNVRVPGDLCPTY